MKPFETEDLIATIRDSLARRTLLRDSLRLQTLLPLLEINQILQGPGGETSLARRILEIAHRETGAARLAWLSCQNLSMPPLAESGQNDTTHDLIEIAMVPQKGQPRSHLPQQAINTVLAQAQPIWILADGTLVDKINGQPNIVGVLLPMIIKGEVAGILTAETGDGGRTSPFDQISLDLLSVLAGQLAIIIENVQLFNQTRTLHAFNEDIIQNMTNGLIAIDKHSHITAFNPAAAAMLGCTVDQVLRQPLSEAINQTQELIEIFQKTLTTGQPDTRHEISMQRLDGNQLPVSVNTAPLAPGDADNGKIAGVVGVLEDLSERKALEAERRRLDRLAALGEMSAVVAHEIRNPIASIAAGVEYLAAKMPKDSPEMQGSAMIQSEIQRVNRILEDILSVARPFQLNLSTENLSDIIADVVQRCQPQIEKCQVTISTIHNPDLPTFKIDRQRLEQVFTNLIINAIQAMQSSDQQAKERKLILQTGVATQAGSIRQKGRLPEQVIITIADTGPGISNDIRQQIFEPFFTTKARGTGLGLTVARRIVEEHRGTIKIEGNEGQGTRFIITLPIQREETA